MNTTETLKRFEEIQTHYVNELNGFSMEQLTRQLSPDEWSLGQLYVHLVNSALYLHLGNADKCVSRSTDAVFETGEKTDKGKWAFAEGSFPPVRIQVPPSPQYTPQQPESKEQLIQGLNAVLRRMTEVELALKDSDPRYTMDHPGFGALNAAEWFTIVEMHYRHHLQQKERLKQFLAS